MRNRSLLLRGLLFGLILQVNLLLGQGGGLVRFDRTFALPSGAKISFGRKVLLSGPKDSTTTKLVVSWNVGIQEGSREATLSDTTWTLLIGPFPAREQAIFQFQSTSSFSPPHLKGLVRKALGIFVDSLFKLNIEATPKEYQRLVVELVPDVVPKELQKYKSTSGETLYKLLVVAIGKLEQKKILALVQDIQTSKQRQEDIRKLRSDVQHDYLDKAEFSLLAKQYDESGRSALANTLRRIKQNPAIIGVEAGILDSLKTAIEGSPSLRADAGWSSTFVSKVREIGTLKTAIDASEQATAKITDPVVDEAAWPLVQVRDFSWVSETTAEVSDVEYYAGFDVAGAVVSDFGVVPFFTVNIYFKKVEIDQDPHDYSDRLSLTTGLALRTTDIPGDGAAYYVGAGYRLNKLFRFTLGSTLYNTVDSKKLAGRLSVGLSLHFRYLADLLKIFNGAASSITPQQ